MVWRVLGPLDSGEDRDGLVGQTGHHGFTHRTLPARSGPVQLAALHVDALGATEDAQHDLPGGVLLVELPA